MEIKRPKSVTLNSSEAEFVALTEAAKEIKFIVQILQSMGISVKLPIICRVDNVGAIFMAENIDTTSRGSSKIRLRKVQSGSADPQIIIWRSPQRNRQPVFLQFYDARNFKLYGSSKLLF
jgi:hypothetical protein